ncbi:serine/threonine-protein kinase [bacterium]|nr:serine/threonine-protein kinase [bacterium]
MIGQTISHYKIIDKVGEGGMGVVYKAQDLNLDRFVALKFLPERLSNSEQDRARFLQEAKAASALNHPNICTIYGIEEHDKQMFIVMELVEGQTLTEKKSAISYKQAIDIGIQLAEGLSAAHEKGIVHRDIKPDNIMIRKDGIAQIMDFGLAKLRGVSRLTKEGSTVGTAGYMAPEQVQGQDVDHRSDIFSLGVLLYELITKQLPFRGVHETALMYEIVNVDAPPMSSVKQDIDPSLDAIILECMEKDPNERTQAAKQVAIDLKRFKRESSRSRVSMVRPAMTQSKVSPAITSTHPTEKGRPAPWLLIGVVAVLMLLIGYGISFFTKSPDAALPVIRASIDIPTGLQYNDNVGGNSFISPDGSKVVFAASDSLSHKGLWVLSLKSNEAKALAGTETAQYPFWSPDGRWIGFFADGKVKTIDAGGGPVIEIADAPFGRGGAWSNKGVILYSPSVSDPNLYAVSASGGTPRMVTAFDSSQGSAPRFPCFLPDGNHFFFSFLKLSSSFSHSGIYLGALDDTASTKILDDAANGTYSSGYIFYLRQGILMAQPFDAGSFKLSGKPVSLQGNVNSWIARAKGDFSVTGNGILMYAISSGSHENELLWIKDDGTESVISQFENWLRVALSPDENVVAYDKIDDARTNSSVWMYDLRSKVHTRLTFTPGVGAVSPCWSGDGKKIYYHSEVGGSKASLYVKQSDGSGEETLVAQGDRSSNIYNYTPEDVSPDGRYLLIRVGNESGSELQSIDLTKVQIPASLEKLGIQGSNGKFSRDGKWIVYQSVESGTTKIYVSSFKGISGKWQVPSDAGIGAMWSNDKVIYYSTARDRYESCAVSFAAGSPAFGQPKPLFPARSKNVIIHAVSKDGKKYLALRPVNAGTGADLRLIVNWKELVKSEP